LFPARYQSSNSARVLVRLDYIASFIADAIATVTVSLWGRMKS
jgi:hypothetical protein